jgi:shikimate kinase
MHNYFLIGMPGSGKTFWAKQLANSLGVAFRDTDEMIVAKTGKTIPAIFEENGEAYFRKMETEVLQELRLLDRAFVCSTGGGLPFYFDNFSLMKQNGTIIYLQASIPFLQQNLIAEKEQRPLLKEGNLEEKLQQLFNERKAVYEQADFIIDVEQLTLTQLQNLLFI